ncbi:MAG: hypothetical protein ACO1SV_10995 [Fimbriimonas sp.]
MKFVWAILVLIFLNVSLGRGQAAYDVVSIPDDLMRFPNLTNDGVLYGSREVDTPNGTALRGAIWENGVVRTLPVPPGFDHMKLVAMNGQGHYVGVAWVGKWFDPARHMVHFDGVAERIIPFPENTYVHAIHGMSEAGDFVYETNKLMYYRHRDKSLHELVTHGWATTIPYALGGRPISVSTDGRVAGLLWDPATGIRKAVKFVDFVAQEVFPGATRDSHVADVLESGRLVGMGPNTTPLWTLFEWENGRFNWTEFPNGAWYPPIDANNRGEILLDGMGAFAVGVLRGGRLDLIVPEAVINGEPVAVPVAINDRGEILLQLWSGHHVLLKPRAASARLVSLRFSPTEVDTAGQPVDALVETFGAFRKVQLGFDPSQFRGFAPPPIQLVQRSGRWTTNAPILTHFLRNALVQPVTVTALGTREDGTISRLAGTLGVKQPTPKLNLGLTASPGEVLRSGDLLLSAFASNPNLKVASLATMRIRIPAGVSVVSSTPSMAYDPGQRTLTWLGMLSPKVFSGVRIAIRLRLDGSAQPGATLAFEGDLSCPGFTSATATASAKVADSELSGIAAQEMPNEFGLVSGLLAPTAQTILNNASGLRAQLSFRTEVETLIPWGGTRPLTMWFEVVDKRSTYGHTVDPIAGVSVEAALAHLNIAAPGAFPAYDSTSSFRKRGDEVDLTLMLTPKAFLCSLTHYIALGAGAVRLDQQADLPKTAEIALEAYEQIGSFRELVLIWQNASFTTAGLKTAVAKTVTVLVKMTDSEKRAVLAIINRRLGLSIQFEDFKKVWGTIANVSKLWKAFADTITWCIQTKGGDMRIRYTAF